MVLWLNSFLSAYVKSIKKDVKNKKCYKKCMLPIFYINSFSKFCFN